MTDLAIITGTFSDLKIIRTRSACQVVVEIPIEAADAALKALGGVPQPGKEVSVAVYRMAIPQEPKAKRGTLAQQCGILCGDPVFLKFLTEKYGYFPLNDFDAAADVRQICGVKSRTEFDLDPDAGTRWLDLKGLYQAWKLL